MNQTLRLSPGNSVRFFPEGYQKPVVYGFAPYGMVLFSHSLKEWEKHLVYLKKVQVDDPVSIQFHLDFGILAAQLHILKYEGTLLKTVAAIAGPIRVPGNIDEQGHDLATLHYEFTPAVLNELDGQQFIYMRISCSWEGGKQSFYRSEPIWLAKEHKNTVLLQYYNNRNDYDTIFQQIRATFARRIPSFGTELKMMSEQVTSENQIKELRKLSAKSYRNYIWEIGGETGVTNFDLDAISFALDCDTFFLDGKKYRKEEGAEFEQPSEEGAALKFSKMLLREADHKASYTFGERDLLLWERPGTGFPYAFFEVALEVNGVKMYSALRIHGNEAAEDQLIDNWNNLRAEKGLRGVFEKVVDGSRVMFYYRQAEGENVTVKQPEMFPFSMQLGVNVLTLAAGNVTYTFRGGNHVLQVVDGAGNGPGQMCYGNDFAATPVVRADLPQGSYTAKIFHNDYMLNFQYAANHKHQVTSIGGRCPAFLEGWDMSGADFSAIPELSLEFFRPTANVLHYLRLWDCKINAFAPNWAGSFTAPNSQKPYGNLRTILLGNNLFNTLAVDNFFNTFAKGANWAPATSSSMPSIYIDTVAGTAAPSTNPFSPSNSISARRDLRNAGWYLSHD